MFCSSSETRCCPERRCATEQTNTSGGGETDWIINLSCFSQWPLTFSWVHTAVFVCPSGLSGKPITEVGMSRSGLYNQQPLSTTRGGVAHLDLSSWWPCSCAARISASVFQSRHWLCFSELTSFFLFLFFTFWGFFQLHFSIFSIFCLFPVSVSGFFYRFDQLFVWRFSQNNKPLLMLHKLKWWKFQRNSRADP